MTTLATVCCKRWLAFAVVLAAMLAAGCGGGEDEAAPTDVVLLTHDSFAISKDVRSAFERESGLRLRILQAGDANETLNRALLTAGDPQGDVIFGLDDSVLSRAIDGDLLEEYRPDALASVAGTYVAPYDQVTPIDHGEVCLNVDRAWFAERGLAPPSRLEELTEPRYRNLLVVENPATSSPGLAFLLATVARFGEDGWSSYWRGLRANGVLAVDGWEEAYTQQFSGAAGSPGKRPIVVSYATSPAAEVIFATKPPEVAPTAAVEDGCYRQVEYAGILRGARNEDGRPSPDRLHALGELPGRRTRLDVRLSGARGRRAAGGLRRARARPGGSRLAAAGRDRREPRPLGRRVDRDRRALRGMAVAAVPVAFLAVFFAWPLLAILERSLASGGGLDVPLDVLTRDSTVEIAWFTVWQATVSTVLTLLAGLPLAWALARFRFRGRSLVEALVLVPFVLPTVVVATAFVALLPDGVEQTVWAILLAHVFFNVAVVVRVVGAFWAGLDPRLGDAAATLGASPVQRHLKVTLPLLGPALASAASIVFLFCFTSFGVIVVLGGLRFATLESEIYNQAARLFDLRTAAALALLQLGAVALTVLVSGALERRLGVRLGHRRPARSPIGHERILVAAVVGVSTVLLALPPLALVVRSLRVGDGHGLAHFRSLAAETPALLVAPWHAILNSLVFASAATAIALAVGIPAAVVVARGRRGVDALVMLPLGASAAMLGFGFLLAFDEPLDLRSSPAIVPIAQALVAIPFVVRALVPALRAADVRLREAAAVLGASPGRIRREIELPLLARPLAVAAGLAFAVALGEFGATIFVARADWPTVPVAIFRFLGRPGEDNVGTAMALCVVLMAIVAAVALVSERSLARRVTR